MDGPQTADEWVAAFRLMAALESIRPQDRQRALKDALDLNRNSCQGK